MEVIHLQHCQTNCHYKYQAPLHSCDSSSSTGDHTHHLVGSRRTSSNENSECIWNRKCLHVHFQLTPLGWPQYCVPWNSYFGWFCHIVPNSKYPETERSKMDCVCDLQYLLRCSHVYFSLFHYFYISIFRGTIRYFVHWNMGWGDRVMGSHFCTQNYQDFPKSTWKMEGITNNEGHTRHPETTRIKEPRKGRSYLEQCQQRQCRGVMIFIMTVSTEKHDITSNICCLSNKNKCTLETRSYQ